MIARLIIRVPPLAGQGQPWLRTGAISAESVSQQICSGKSIQYYILHACIMPDHPSPLRLLLHPEAFLNAECEKALKQFHLNGIHGNLFD
jgi:hypothetical protein